MCLSHFIYTERPCLIHTCHAAPMPSPIMPFFLRSQHSMAVERGSVGLLPRFGFFQLSRGVPRSFYQTHTNLRCRWPVWNQTPFVMDEEKSGSSTLQKRRSVMQFGYFRLPCGLSRRTRHCRSRAGPRHGLCELTHGIAGERHGHGTGTACYVWIGL